MSHEFFYTRIFPFHIVTHSFFHMLKEFLISEWGLLALSISIQIHTLKIKALNVTLLCSGGILWIKSSLVFIEGKYTKLKFMLIAFNYKWKWRKMEKLWSENKKFLPWIRVTGLCGKINLFHLFFFCFALFYFIISFVAVFLVNGNQSIWFKWKILAKLGEKKKAIHAKKIIN